MVKIGRFKYCPTLTSLMAGKVMNFVRNATRKEVVGGVVLAAAALYFGYKALPQMYKDISEGFRAPAHEIHQSYDSTAHQMKDKYHKMMDDYHPAHK
jgi:ABC-type nickel/cobalt efflux system permease component RcnA